MAFSSQSRRRVLIGLSWGSYAMIEGIVSFAKKAGWILDLSLMKNGGRPPPVWLGDGIIIVGSNAEMARLVKSSSLPTVNLSIDPAELPCHRVYTHHERIVELAVEHFRQRHFRNFLVCKLSRKSTTERLRLDGFARSVAAIPGCSCDVFEDLLYDETGAQTEGVIARLAEYLRAKPKPFGVFCHNDEQALRVLEAAERAGIAVPDEIAVLGVNNERLACDFTDPTLSSIDCSHFEVGYEGAATLDKLLDGRDQPPVRMIEPRGVITRESTETWATTDPLVRKALKYIWKHYGRSLRVSDIAAKLHISRVTLNNRFMRAFGTSVGQEITRRRIEIAKRLLARGDVNASDIYKQVGFGNLATFSRAFRRVAGHTATEWRLDSSK